MNVQRIIGQVLPTRMLFIWENSHIITFYIEDGEQTKINIVFNEQRENLDFS